MNNSKFMFGYCPVCDKNVEIYTKNLEYHCPVCSHHIDAHEIPDDKLFESMKYCGCVPDCDWCSYHDPKKEYSKKCYDRRNIDFEYFIEHMYLKIAQKDSETKRLKVLADLGEMRANDYRVMRDRALEAEAKIERLEEEVNWYRGSGAGAINRCPREKNLGDK